MNPPTPSPSDCPDLEDLAAFADGVLTGTAREAVVAHLADCEDCYEVYAEALHIQQDLSAQEDLHGQEDLESRLRPVAVIDEGEAELAPILVHPRSRAWIWKAGAALATAATLAFVVRIGFLTPSVAPIGKSFVPTANIPAIARTSAATRPSLPENWPQHGWPIKRGGLAPDISTNERDNQRRAFRLGVHAVDLETALWMEEGGIASRQTHLIENLIERIDFSQPWIQSIQDLRKKILAEAPQAELLNASFGLKEEWPRGEYPLIDPFYFSFGRWTEIARLDLLTGNLGPLSSTEFKDSLRNLQKRDLSPRVSAEVEKIERLIAAGSSEELTKVFEEIIRYEGT